MNATCTSCNTVYRIDPAKVSHAGVRARCTVCSSVISVPAPGSQQQAVGDGVAPPSRPSQAEIVAQGLGDAYIPVPTEAATAPAVTPAPALAPAAPPVAAPAVVPPVVAAPIQPPAVAPIQPPAVAPIQPPAVATIQPPAVAPIQPPAAAPAAQIGPRLVRPFAADPGAAG